MLRRRRMDSDHGPDLNRVVTPMLDMSFQLLFLFLIQFRPMVEEGQVDLQIAAEGKGGMEALWNDDGPPDEYVIHINSIVPHGGGKPVVVDAEDIRAIRFTSKLESVAFAPEDLLGQLEKKLRSLPKYDERKDKTKPALIKLQINNRLKYEAVIDLLDRCRAIGKEKNIKDVGLMGYPKDKGGPALMP